MRTIRELPIPKNDDYAKFPDGQIKDETSTEAGTPVYSGVYGDLIANIYAILRYSGETPNQEIDSEETSYQLLEAFKKFSNELNDLRQVLTVSGTAVNAAFNFDSLPNGYVFIGKVSGALQKTVNYSLNSQGVKSVPFTVANDVSASSTVLVTVEASTASVIDLTKLSSAAEEKLSVSFGSPISVNTSTKILYYNNGRVFDETPNSYNVQNLIQTNQGTLDIEVVQVIALQGKLLCFTFNSVTTTYQMFSFDLNNLGVLEGEIALQVDAGGDNVPYMYSDGVNIYFTNSTDTINEVPDDFSIGKFELDLVGMQLIDSDFSDIDANFQKTTNVFINEGSDDIYTYINGDLYRYDFGGVARTFLIKLDTLDGQVFKFNGSNYYSNGDTAIKWNY